MEENRRGGAETGDAALPSDWWLLPAGVELAALPTARLLVERALKENFDKDGRRLRKEDLP